MTRIFWLHVGWFAAYNLLMGYLLLHREERGVRSLVFCIVAIGFHFLVNDYGLREEHKQAYDRVGRWLLAGSVLVGWLSGQVAALPEASVALLFGVLAGGIVLNVLKEELPEERESRFSAFVLGVLAYVIASLASP